jgi:hypothetical protein
MDVLLRVGAHHVHHQLQQARVQVLDLVRVYIGRLRRKLEDDPAARALCSPRRASATASRRCSSHPRSGFCLFIYFAPV